MTERASLLLTREDLVELTGYKRPADQLKCLHARGFQRAAILRGRIILERAHYEAVCAGAIEAPRPKLRPLPPELQPRPRVIPPKVTPPKVLPLAAQQPARKNTSPKLQAAKGGKTQKD